MLTSSFLSLHIVHIADFSYRPIRVVVPNTKCTRTPMNKLYVQYSHISLNKSPSDQSWYIFMISRLSLMTADTVSSSRLSSGFRFQHALFEIGIENHNQLQENWRKHTAIFLSKTGSLVSSRTSRLFNCHSSILPSFPLLIACFCHYLPLTVITRGNCPLRTKTLVCLFMVIWQFKLKCKTFSILRPKYPKFTWSFGL